MLINRPHVLLKRYKMPHKEPKMLQKTHQRTKPSDQEGGRHWVTARQPQGYYGVKAPRPQWCSPCGRHDFESVSHQPRPAHRLHSQKGRLCFHVGAPAVRSAGRQAAGCTSQRLQHGARCTSSAELTGLAEHHLPFTGPRGSCWSSGAWSVF